MRLFTAIPLPEQTKSQFAELVRGRLPIPYVNTSQLHITLNFLGELDTEQAARVKGEWARYVPTSKKFPIEFDRLVKHGRQIHATVKLSKNLQALQSSLAEYFNALGYRSRYPSYYAHMTVGNLHMDKVMYRDRKIENFPNELLSELRFEVEKVVLYESKLLLHHHKHIPLDEIILK